MKNYSYPRVVTSVTPLLRSSARPAAEDTTVLFSPIVGRTGPEKELVKIHSLEEYRSIFGIDKRDSFKRTLLNISNWLTSGGTLYAYRLVGESPKNSVAPYITSGGNGSFSIDVSACAKSKYVGDAINGFNIIINNIDGKYIQYILKDAGVVVERKTLLIDKEKPLQELRNIADITQPLVGYVYEVSLSESSEYLSKLIVAFSISTGTGDNASGVATPNYNAFYTGGSANPKIVGEFYGGTDEISDFNNSLESFWARSGKVYSEDLRHAIGNALETPIDLIMDAGYNEAVKVAMMNAISHFDDNGDVDALRPDINGIFDIENIKSTHAEAFEPISQSNIASIFFGNSECYKTTSNIFLFDQKFVISEETYFGEDMNVYPSYFLSSLIPANDLNNGIQFPVAGKRRGELSGVKKISSNPSPDEKEELFKARINYVEKDSRGYYFMSQRTFDGSTEDAYTALSFINNARVTCKMVHELERLGRDYLFEFNDATTLANISSVMNRYVSNWIANRTLSFGNVVVSADQYSDEKVNAVLNIKFTGTIEVISIDLVLQ